MIYELIKNDPLIGGSTLKRTDLDDSVWWIPLDEANADYQAYLAWLAEQPAK